MYTSLNGQQANEVNFSSCVRGTEKSFKHDKDSLTPYHKYTPRFDIGSQMHNIILYNLC